MPSPRAIRSNAVEPAGIPRFVNFELLPALRVIWQSLFGRPSLSLSGSFAIPADIDLVKVDATAAPVTVTLAAAGTRFGRVRVVKVDASANAVTVTPVEGGVTLAAQWDSADVLSDGFSYYR